MHELAPLIGDLALILCVAGVVTLICQKIKQPVVLGYLLAGLILGPHTPPSIFLHDVGNIQVLAELGVIFLMFALGLEFSFHKLKKVGMPALVTALVEVCVMVLIGYEVGKLLGWSAIGSLFLGAALSISSTTIIVKAFDELRLKSEGFAQLILAVLIVEDLLAILLLVFLTTLSKGGDSTTNIVSDISKLVLVVGSWFLIGYFVIPTLMRKVIGFISNETLTVASIGLCLLMVVIAAYFHYSVALGAFMMGSILAETSLGRRILYRIEPIRDMFAAVFFVSVGMLINPHAIWTHWQAVLLIAVVTIIGKWLATALGALMAGKDIKTSAQVGMGLAQIGEFSFIIVGLGLALKVIDESLYPIVVAVSVLTTFTTPYGIKLSNKVATEIAAKIPEGIHQRLTALSLRRKIFFTHLTKVDPAWHKAIARFLINALLVGIIFSSSAQVFFRWLEASDWLVLLLAWFLTCLLAAPFLWAMLYAFRETVMGSLKLTIGIVAWLLVLLELTFLSHAYFGEWLMTLAIVFASSLSIIVFSNPLQNVYIWFAKRLVENWEEGEKHSDSSH